jgi:hypothetical protein
MTVIKGDDGSDRRCGGEKAGVKVGVFAEKTVASHVGVGGRGTAELVIEKMESASGANLILKWGGVNGHLELLLQRQYAVFRDCIFKGISRGRQRAGTDC